MGSVFDNCHGLNTAISEIIFISKHMMIAFWSHRQGIRTGISFGCQLLIDGRCNFLLNESNIPARLHYNTLYLA